MSFGGSGYGLLLWLVFTVAMSVSCAGNSGPSTEPVTTEDSTVSTVEEEETVPGIEVTQISSGVLGQGRKSPYVVVSDSLEKTNMETTSLPPEDETYLTVYRGEERTSGYSVGVESVRREGGEVVVTLELRDPPEGAILAQVITYPYTVVAMTGVSVDDEFVFEDRSGERLDWPVER